MRGWAGVPGRRSLRVLLAGIGGIVLLLAVAEGTLRLLGPWRAPRLLREDPVLGWSFVPGASGVERRVDFRVEVHINAHGLRDVEHAYARPADTLRVVTVGDAFTEGMGVPLEEAYPRRLEEVLRRETGRRVEVINGGVRAYNPQQYYLWLRIFGRLYRPDVVVIGLNLGNDLTRTRSRGGLYTRPAVAAGGGGSHDVVLANFPVSFAVAPMVSAAKWWLKERSDLAMFVWEWAKRSEPLRVWLGKGVDVMDLGLPDREAFLPGSPRLRDGLEDLERIVRAIRADLAPAAVVLALIPLKAQIDPGERERFRRLAGGAAADLDFEGVIRLAAEAGNRAGAVAVDLTPALQTVPGGARQAYFPIYAYWNARGHAAAARALAAALVEAGLVPRAGPPAGGPGREPRAAAPGHPAGRGEGSGV